MMLSAFILGEPCGLDSLNSTDKCTETHGTIVSSYQLTGNRAAFAEFTSSAFSLGGIGGSLIFPVLSDMKGRRIILVLCLFFVGVSGCGAALSMNIFMFTIFRFAQGFFSTGLGVTPYVLGCESIPMKLRSYTALLAGLLWVAGYCIVGYLAYAIVDWRQLIMFTSIPQIIVAILYYFILPESLHYLALKGESKNIKTWLNRANRFASVGHTERMKEGQIQVFCENAAQIATKEIASQKINKTGLVHHLMNNRLLVVYTLILVYLWVCDSFVYYGLSLYSTKLDGDKYTNYQLLGLIEIPSYLFSPILLNRLGRQKFISLCHLLAAISFITVIFIENVNITLLMWLISKFAIACAFTGLFVYATEIFPTVVRNGCIGICTVAGGFGSVLAPTIRIIDNISPSLPKLCFGVFAGLGAALTLLLPETLNRELPDAPDEIARKDMDDADNDKCGTS
ncbi:major facilitator superfamily domain-containing protein [Ditylenchus destructor]|uniref:Major facilitator superfamily domain-containing protein n=1 Tax=Ditylenchus destructor TaxID=166010 RepID=A0AAD4NF72_9BILA|nr:major facilitator superfamily domain-containing protein [Ditylenchus destructor]